MIVRIKVDIFRLLNLQLKGGRASYKSVFLYSGLFKIETSETSEARVMSYQ